MRITREVTEIDYEKTLEFFKNRAGKFHEDNPYAVTMYQDNDKELVYKRNKKEVEILRPFLALAPESRVLDVACGIGRWADAIDSDIDEYCGIDFSRELIGIAMKRNNRPNFHFYQGAANEIGKVLSVHGKSKFNTVLMMGIMIYLNDNDLDAVLDQVAQNCAPHALICIREPIGVNARLTLKDFFSEELQDDYNAIYRTRDEINCFLGRGVFQKGFRVKKEGFLFEEDSLNNRKETAQYYFVLERTDSSWEEAGE